MFGRTLKLSIAKDNGRSTEFNSKRLYPEKERCYECGQEGHLSYRCPINVLGNRDPPSKAKNNKKRRPPGTAESMQATGIEFDENQCDDGVSFLMKNALYKNSGRRFCDFLEDKKSTPCSPICCCNLTSI